MRLPLPLEAVAPPAIGCARCIAEAMRVYDEACGTALSGHSHSKRRQQAAQSSLCAQP